MHAQRNVCSPDVMGAGAATAASATLAPNADLAAIFATKRLDASELTRERIEAAFEYCRQASWKHAKTFYFATRFLPKPKRRAVHAVYALCRYVDDIVDHSEDKLLRRSLTKEKIVLLIDKWRNDLEACYAGALIDHPIMIAWHETLKRYHIPKRLPLELIDGVCMDLKQNRYETFDDLYPYCYKVASVVGLMTSEIFGYASEEALKRAVELGIAMQLTNILRDVGEDARKGRIYLPLEDLRRFGVSEEEILSGAMSENFVNLMKFEIERARFYYAESEKGIAMLSPDSRLAVKVSHDNYSRILRRIEELNYDVFNQRAFVSNAKKIALLPYLWLKARTL
ncbi:MAG: squalene/phytoene synthase family protein [Chloroherpetonaceae bacterium]|nr:squalene/phytoene synthase family protein [Chloroherpetonaceae bacterium]MDW8438794.1 squalene/phytoene synthase family protein [Chloroherpetonaceae bacterium]